MTAVAELIARTAPDTVVTFVPDGFTGHGDHRRVGAWTDEAFAVAAAPGARPAARRPHHAVVARGTRTPPSDAPGVDGHAGSTGSSGRADGAASRSVAFWRSARR